MCSAIVEEGTPEGNPKTRGTTPNKHPEVTKAKQTIQDSARNIPGSGAVTVTVTATEFTNYLQHHERWCNSVHAHRYNNTICHNNNDRNVAYIPGSCLNMGFQTTGHDNIRIVLDGSWH